jgi:hypothetical protein
MSSQVADTFSLDTLDDLLSALESAASRGEWNSVSVLEPRLTGLLTQMPQSNAMTASPGNRARIASLLSRVEILRIKFQERSQQIAPLLGALVPMDDISPPGTP